MASLISLLALFGFSTSPTQTPPLTGCPGQSIQEVIFYSLTFKGATLGGTLKADAVIGFTEEFGDDPMLHIGVARPDGTPLTCIPGLWQCDLKLCGGTTAAEKELNAGWHNKCPIKRGIYTARMTFPLPDINATRQFYGDGHIVVTLQFVNGGKTVECVSLPLTVDVHL